MDYNEIVRDGLIDSFTEFRWLISELSDLINISGERSICVAIECIDKEDFKKKENTRPKSNKENYIDALRSPLRDLERSFVELPEGTYTDAKMAREAMKDLTKKIEFIIDNTNTYTNLLIQYIISKEDKIMEVNPSVSDILNSEQLQKFFTLEDNYNHFLRHYNRFASRVNHLLGETIATPKFNFMKRLTTIEMVNKI